MAVNAKDPQHRTFFGSRMHCGESGWCSESYGRRQADPGTTTISVAQVRRMVRKAVWKERGPKDGCVVW